MTETLRGATDLQARTMMARTGPEIRHEDLGTILIRLAPIALLILNLSVIWATVTRMRDQDNRRNFRSAPVA